MVAAGAAATWMKLAAKYCSSIIAVAVIVMMLASGNYFVSRPCRRPVVPAKLATQDCP